MSKRTVALMHSLHIKQAQLQALQNTGRDLFQFASLQLDSLSQMVQRCLSYHFSEIGLAHSSDANIGQLLLPSASKEISSAIFSELSATIISQHGSRAELAKAEVINVNKELLKDVISHFLAIDKKVEDLLEKQLSIEAQKLSDNDIQKDIETIDQLVVEQKALNQQIEFIKDIAQQALKHQQEVQKRSGQDENWESKIQNQHPFFKMLIKRALIVYLKDKKKQIDKSGFVNSIKGVFADRWPDSELSLIEKSFPEHVVYLRSTLSEAMQTILSPTKENIVEILLRHEKEKDSDFVKLSTWYTSDDEIDGVMRIIETESTALELMGTIAGFKELMNDANKNYMLPQHFFSYYQHQAMCFWQQEEDTQQVTEEPHSILVC